MEISIADLLDEALVNAREREARKIAFAEQLKAIQKPKDENSNKQRRRRK